MATLLSFVVLAITVVVLLAIWDVIQIENWQEIAKKALYSMLTLFIGAVIIVFIYNTLYRQPIKPPKPPGEL